MSLFDFSRPASPFTEAQEARIREIVAEVVWTRPGHLKDSAFYDLTTVVEPADGPCPPSRWFRPAAAGEK